MGTRYSLDYQKDEGQRLGLMPHCADDHTWLLVTPPHELLPLLRLRRYSGSSIPSNNHKLTSTVHLLILLTIISRAMLRALSAVANPILRLRSEGIEVLKTDYTSHNTNRMLKYSVIEIIHAIEEQYCLAAVIVDC
ncbi:hypothetical protein IG631_07494 [Alternaria alternata]|nr:hypothetical protein IG631_07494 [Alternaria alternata]